MDTTVRQVLEVLRRTPARPAVVVGQDDLDRPVRWVHTSEIYNIAALLSGREMLLTSGLGLVGTNAAQQRAYVESLADQHVSALAIEVGRTFPTVPPALLETCRNVDLILVVLHGTTPFVKVLETVHRELLDSENASLRRRAHAVGELTESLLTGYGLNALLTRVEGVLAAEVGLVGTDERVLAGADPRAVGEPTYRVPISLHERPWGQLLVWRQAAPVDAALVDACADAVALEVMRTSGIADTPEQRERDLVTDIATGSYVGTADLRSRCAALGLVPQRGEAFVPLAFGLHSDKPASRTTAVVSRAARGLFSRHAAARIEDEFVVLGIARVPDEDALRALVREFTRAFEAELAADDAGRPVAVAAGDVTLDPRGLSQSVRQAREASALARRLGSSDRGTLSRDLGVARLLSKVLDDDELESFVVREIGPILEYDAAHATEMLRTLDVYLTSGLSKSHAAAELGVQRQTLYRRLALISNVLGGADLNRYERRAALEIAVTAWKLRHSAQTVSVVKRGRR